MEETRSRVRVVHQKAFLPLGKVLCGASNLEELLSLSIESLVEAVAPADAGILYLYDEGRQQLVAKASRGYHCDHVEHSLRLNEGAPGRCYALRKSLLFPSVEAITQQTATLRPENLDCHIKIRQGLPPILSMVATPLVLAEKVFGVVLLEHYKQHRLFKGVDVSQVENVTSWISLAIDDMQSHLGLKHTKRSYRELLGRWITVTEEERSIIAREIHDEVNQLLLSVKLNLENMESTLPADFVAVRNMLEMSKTRISQAFDELHKLVISLRPPGLDHLGLAQALDWYVHNCPKEDCLSITMEVNGLSQRRPAPVVETNLFRIAQESLSNVIKHARATSATVTLSFEESRLVLAVEDNGVGFDVDALLSTSDDRRNLGLLGMNERAKLCGGTLEIESFPGGGTRTKVEVPISSYDWGAY